MTQKKKTVAKAKSVKAAPAKKVAGKPAEARVVRQVTKPVAAKAVTPQKKPTVKPVAAAPAAKPVTKAPAAKTVVEAKTAPAKSVVKPMAPVSKSPAPVSAAKSVAKTAAPSKVPAAKAVEAAAPVKSGAPAKPMAAGIKPKVAIGPGALASAAATAKPAPSNAAPARTMPALAKGPQAPKLTAPAGGVPMSPKALAEKAMAARQAINAQAMSQPKKPVSSRHGFKTNEFIVYPAHGVGRIVGIEEQEIAGISLELFVITFEKEKLTLRVPTGKLESVGMRKLADDGIVKRAMEILKGRARIKRTMWSRRAQEYVAKINSGDLVSIAEVVRDLYRSEAQPEQSYSERQLYEDALDRMAREIAAVEKLDDRGAVQLITDVLAKSARGRRVAEEGGDAEIQAA
ncbi:MAG: CarD family transcriptional regulator [Hyphomicrobium sp.]|nr:CarD family transcriptional regulator [Hyphomicrobium sp.]